MKGDFCFWHRGILNILNDPPDFKKTGAILNIFLNQSITFVSLYLSQGRQKIINKVYNLSEGNNI